MIIEVGNRQNYNTRKHKIYFEYLKLVLYDCNKNWSNQIDALNRIIQLASIAW